MTKLNQPITEIIDGCYRKIAEKPGINAKQAELDALLAEITDANHSHDEIGKLTAKLADEWLGFVLTMSEEMFLAGWKLRANPDRILELRNGYDR